MTKPVNILLQTTTQYFEDDWNISRFSLLAGHLRSQKDENGNALYEVTMRDRQSNRKGGDDLLGSLHASDFDQLWLFALDDGNGLTAGDCAGITRFRNRGGGILSVRDHYDMGSSLCTVGGIGAAHYFHSRNPDPDESRNCRDDQDSPEIDYPNYHSGANGDYQTIVAADHELFRREDGSLIEYFPAHPHEGGIGAPDASALVIATGTSKVTNRAFNLVVAFESSVDANGDQLGRAIAESSFHHFVDYNWDIDAGCPSFLSNIDKPGDGYKQNPAALDDIKQYVQNAAKWLSR